MARHLLASRSLFLLLAAAALTLSGCGGGGSTGGGSAVFTPARPGEAIRLGAKILLSGDGSGGPTRLRVVEVASLTITVYAGSDRSTPVIASARVGVGPAATVAELDLPGIEQGAHLVTVAVSDSAGLLLEEAGCVFPLGPGITTDLSLIVSSAGLALTGPDGGCQTPARDLMARLQVSGFSLTPASVSPGGLVALSLTVANAGDLAAEGVSPEVRFSQGGSDVTSLFVTGVSPPGGGPLVPVTPARIGPGEQAQFELLALVPAGALSGTVTASPSARGTGTPEALGDDVSFNVQAGSPLALGGGLKAPQLVSQGQTFVASYTVTSSAGAAIDVSDAALQISGTGLTAIPRGSNPATLDASSSAVFEFDVTVATDAPPGPRSAAAQVSGIVRASGETVELSSALAGTVTVQRPAAAGSPAFAAPSFVSRGQSFQVTVTVSNTGEATGRVESATLGFEPAGDLTVTPSRIPSSLAGGVAASFEFSVVAGAAATSGERAVRFSLSLADANSGATSPFEATAPAPVTVQSPASLAFQGGLRAPATVSAGQTFVASFTIANSGEAGASLDQVTLDFGSPEISAVLSGSSGGPSGSGTEAVMFFEVTVSPATDSGPYTGTGAVSARDANSGAPAGIAATALGSVTVEQPASLTAGASFTAPETVAQGESFVVTIAVTNSGEAAAVVATAALGFDDATGLTHVPLPGPARVEGGATAVFGFTVLVADFATPGVRALSFALEAADENSDANVGVPPRAAGSVRVVAPAGLFFSGGLRSPASVSLGQSFVASFTVGNNGTTPADVAAARLAFGGGGMTAVARGTNPAQVPAAGSADFVFDVAIDPAAAPGTRIASAGIDATDSTTGGPVGISSASLGTVLLQSPPDLSGIGPIVAPAQVSLGQSFTATVTVANAGTAAAGITTAELRLSPATGLTVRPRQVPATIPGESAADFSFDVDVAASAPSGPLGAELFLGAVDANSGADASVTGTAAGTIELLVPAALALVDGLRAPAVGSQGGTYIASYSVTNTGEASAAISAASLSFAGGGVTVFASTSNPTALAGGATGDLVFSFRPDALAATGPRAVSVEVVATDVLSGASASVASASFAVLEIATAADIDFTGVFRAPARVSQSASAVASFSVQNFGAEAVTITTAELLFPAGGVTATADPGNPASIAGGAQRDFLFDLAIDLAAAAGPRGAVVHVGGRGEESGQNVDLLADPAGTITVQAPARIAFASSLFAPPTVSLGQTFTASFTVSNSGEEDAVVTDVGLSFDPAGPSAAVTGTFEGVVPAGGTASYAFTVTVGSALAAVPTTIGAQVTATSTGSQGDVSIATSSVGGVVLQDPPALVIVGGLQAPATASRGRSFIASVTVANAGGAAAELTSTTLTFAGGGLAATPRGTNADSLPGGDAATMVFDVAVDLTAPAGPHAASVAIEGRDSNSQAVVSTSSSAIGSVGVLRSATLTIGAVGDVAATPGESVLVSVSIANGGDQAAAITTVSLSLDDPSSATIGLLDAPATISGLTTETALFDIAMGASAEAGVRSILASVVASDSVSPLNVSTSRDGAGRLLVSSPRLFITSVLGQSPVNLGQVGVGLNVQLTSGQTGSFTVGGAGLAFSVPGLVESSGPDLPVSLPGLAVRTLSFLFDVAPDSVPGPVVVTATAVASHDASATVVTTSGPATGALLVQVPSRPTVEATTLVAQTGVDRSGSPLSVSLDVMNGEPTTATLRLESGDVEFTATSGAATDGQPAFVTTLVNPELLVTGGDTGSYQFSISALQNARKHEPITALFHVQFQDVNDGGLTPLDLDPLQFFVREAANAVYGQDSLLGALPNRGAPFPIDAGFDSPGDVVTDGQVFAVSDSANNRVLLFPSLTATAPSTVIGQASFTSATPAAGAGGLSDPAGLAIAGQRLVVADRGNHRVLIYQDFRNLPPTGGQASVVIGQSTFDAVGPNGATGTPAADTLLSPADAAVGGPTLFVADRGNHRVLGYTGFDVLQNGAAANFVLGQPEFNLVSPNQDGSVSSASLFSPSGLSVTTQSLLFIADRDNHRVVVHDVSVPKSGQFGLRVLGQANGSTVEPNRGFSEPAADTMSSPVAVALSGARLLVSDSGNHRVLIFDDFSTLSGGDRADDLLGHAVFDVRVASDTVDAAFGTDPFSLNGPGGVDALGLAALLVVDAGANRVLRIAYP